MFCSSYFCRTINTLLQNSVSLVLLLVGISIQWSGTVFYLFPLTFFVYSVLSLSPSVCFFVCLLLSFLAFFYFPFWVSSSFFLCLSSIIFPLLVSLSFLPVYVLLLLSFCPSFLYFLPFNFLSAFFDYFSIFSFLSCFSYFALLSTLFSYLVLILGFNYCNFSLFFSINLCYLSLFFLAVFFTKYELFNFFTFQLLL